MTALWIILGILALLLIVLVFNAFRIKKGMRKLTPEKENVTPEESERLAGELGRMIRCETVSSKDSYDDTEFKKLREVIRDLFPTFHEKAELKIFGDDCWIYKIPGKDTSRNIMVMSHHDVVGPGKDEWEHPPFCGEIFDGNIWGRGTLDTKTPLFAEFRAIEDLLNEGYVPSCNLYLGSSHNEEYGGDGIPLALKYFEENNIEFELILDEGGAVIDAPLPGLSCECAMLAVHEKGRHGLRCTAQVGDGHAGLGASPETPVVRMAKFIAETDKKKPFIRRIYPQVRAMFEELAPYMSFPFRLIFANLWLFGPLLKVLMPKVNPMGASMLGTMCAFSTIQCDRPLGNIQAKKVEAVAFMRCIDDKDLAEDIKALKKIGDKYGITIEDMPDAEYHEPADLTKPALAYVKKCVGEIFPHAACAPYILPAGTDARWLCGICPCVVRFAPIYMDSKQFKTVHSQNENISVKAVGDAVAFYKKFLRDYE